MRRICMTALFLSALSASAFADPLQVAVYPYGTQPVYVAQQPAAPQYYVYAQQPRYTAAPANYAQSYASVAPQAYAPAAAPAYTGTVPQAYAAPAPQAYAPAAAPAYTGTVPQAYPAPAPQAYAPAAPAPEPEPSSPGGGGFLQAIFGGPTINVPVSRPYPGYQAPMPQPQAPAVAPQQQAYAPTNPPDESNYPINPKFQRQVVAYNGDEKPGTIIVDTPDKFLFLIEGDGRALRYGIGVGRPGFTWAGVKTITAKKEWPDWTPPPEMVARQPGLPRFMPGGLGNPLGSRALYLGSTLYRIHGSNEPWTIGTNVSSGCIRMRNADVEDLFNRVHVGTKVVVM
jgi:lipoprotein-anchoring transpeptidase ErfK/SrfK